MSQQPASVSYQALEQARDKLEQNYHGKGGNAHTFYIGELEKEGEPVRGPDGQPQIGLVVLVEDKIPRAQLAEGEAVPKSVKLNHLGVEIPVDVQQAPQPKDLRLSIFQAEVEDPAAFAGNVNDWRRCHNFPLQGGVQIAPEGAGWVGTLSCAVRGRGSDGQMMYGALTNYHVAVAQGGRRGHRMCQPVGSAPHFGFMERFHPISFSQSASNEVDGAFLATYLEGGPFGTPGGYSVIPEQYQLGRIVPRPYAAGEQVIGGRVVKSGRTTGIMRGRIVGVGASTYVGYDQGTARFVNQLITRGDNGDMSRPGDSGSLVLDDELRPLGLLFAGGGGTTIVNPIDRVIAAFGFEFF